MKTLRVYNTLQKQGILTILPSSDLHSPTLPPPSLRRTLSADMSSTIKNIASSQPFSPPDHNHNHKKIDSQKQTDADSWTSILLPKSATVVPYVHPLLKKASHSLSDISLQICTESLGSETGSDGYSSSSSYPSSEDGDFDEQIITKTECSHVDSSEWKPVKFARKKTPPRSFPPPISSLNSSDGASVCIQYRRENGRLILDAVSVPSRNNFHAERRDGRLILSFVTTPANLFVQEDEDDENDLEISGIQMEQAPRLSSPVIKFHRLIMDVLVKNPNEFINRNPAWPKEKDDSETPIPLSQSLPPRMPSLTAATAAGSLNAYEYYWKSKPTGKSAGIQNSNGQQLTQPIQSVTRKLVSSNNHMADEKQQILVLRGNRGDYLVPLSNGCKVPRRSVLLREPCCIATT